MVWPMPKRTNTGGLAVLDAGTGAVRRPTGREILRLAVESSRDPRSVRKAVRGAGGAPIVLESVLAAAGRLGLVLVAVPSEEQRDAGAPDPNRLSYSEREALVVVEAKLGRARAAKVLGASRTTIERLIVGPPGPSVPVSASTIARIRSCLPRALTQSRAFEAIVGEGADGDES